MCVHVSGIARVHARTRTHTHPSGALAGGVGWRRATQPPSCDLPTSLPPSPGLGSPVGIFFPSLVQNTGPMGREPACQRPAQGLGAFQGCQLITRSSWDHPETTRLGSRHPWACAPQLDSSNEPRVQAAVRAPGEEGAAGRKRASSLVHRFFSRPLRTGAM